MPYAAAATTKPADRLPQTVPANVVEFVNRATNLKTGHLQLVPLPERQIRPRKPSFPRRRTARPARLLIQEREGIN